MPKSAIRLHPENHEIATIAAATEEIIGKQLTELKCDASVSLKAVRDIAVYLLRDLIRIEHQQNDSISAVKFAGYWAFWVRKLKPISNCYPKGMTREDPENEMTTINEIVALEVGLSALIKDGKGRGGNDIYDPVRRHCEKNDCDGRACILDYSNVFFTFDNEAHKQYMIYSMRHRTFGPHHFSTVFENLVFGSCEHARTGRISEIEFPAT